ncbi:CD48 antigen [Hippoglossus stenolepis]|uniref:CD48 antigen n=1 Tax=Hippoglossus stenolepis TaxID=195615 RepID=UPI001FAFEC78|nr:CD48 antigen [Hippoglossus stenolepis]
MSLLIVLVLFLHVVRALSTHNVIGYLGETVTLPSRADPSWNLSKIEWSILTNTTWIATHRGGATNIDRFHRYKGRLSLNITSGDLTIRNLMKEDDMEYTVNLLGPKREVKVIRLIVNKHLQKPTINALFKSPAKGGGCWMGLQCSSQDEGVDFSWKIEPPTEALFNTRHAERNPGEIFMFLKNPEIDVEFTCTTNRTTENVSSAFIQKFDDTRCKEHNCRNRYALCFAIGLAIGLAIAVVLYICRENISPPCK